MNIGEQIAKYRKLKPLTQEQLGEAVGVTNRTVSKWESGVSSPGIDLIPSIASALGITLDMLFGMETQKNTGDVPEKIINELKLEIADSIEYGIMDAVRDELPKALEGALTELLPEYMPSYSNDDYSLVVLGRDKSTVCRFFGQGKVIGPLPKYNQSKPFYYISIPAQGGDVRFEYETKEAAAKDLKAIFDAYIARFTNIEL